MQMSLPASLTQTPLKRLVGLLYDLREERETTVIVATHDEKIVEAADVIYHIHDGKLKPER